MGLFSARCMACVRDGAADENERTGLRLYEAQL